ncbi:MAG: deiodinase family protein [Gemmatales bacterium]|nr:deiodinase family protein [Gemmatales bacterium]MDW8388206.1 deiodinase family protein [Gemmatales bacterium]
MARNWQRWLAGVATYAFLVPILAAASEPPLPNLNHPHAPRWPEGFSPDQLSDSQKAGQVAAWLEEQYPEPRPEAVRMLIAILRGSRLAGTDGWFGPAQSRYTWQWLLQKHVMPPDTAELTAEQFCGKKSYFDQLDRNGDGKLKAEDFDWSDRNPYANQWAQVQRWARRLDADGDGLITAEEWTAFYQRLAQGRNQGIRASDLRQALLPRGRSSLEPGDTPTIPVLVRGLYAQEIGALSPGPNLGDPAPDFTLRTPDGSQSVTLSTFRKTRPLVLCFGNFTCGPFRSLYPEVEEVWERHREHADFLMIYVREAHPTDGWKMVSNERQGVVVSQPKLYDERVAACQQFCKKLHPKMTVVVDELDDRVGGTYSGMPARLYILDHEGRIAYKSGRGPFGFKPWEMEQALIMACIETEAARSRE